MTVGSDLQSILNLETWKPGYTTARKIGSRSRDGAFNKTCIGLIKIYSVSLTIHCLGVHFILQPKIELDYSM